MKIIIFLLAITSLCFPGSTFLPAAVHPQTDVIRQDLHSGWEFAYTEHGKVRQPTDGQGLAFRPATIPGTNLRDLSEARLVEPPTSPTYEDSFAPYKFKDFIYRTAFRADKILRKKRILLCFEGLDTVCEIFLNGEKLAQTENAFLKHVFDIKDKVKKGENELFIIFRSPVIEAEKRMKKFGLAMPDHLDPVTNFAFLRKPAYSFFWDWGPQIPVSGIFRPVYLKSYDEAEIEDFHVSYKIDGNNVSGHIELAVPNGHGAKVTVEIGKKIFLAKVVNNKATVPFEVKQARLWYPNGEGEQFLYDLTISLKAKSLLDQKSHRMGFRTIEVVQDNRKDGAGKRFLFKVNGKEIFCRGYNWIPPDNDITRGYYDVYRRLLDLAKEGNVNMLRVWGGGYYEDDEFYRLCDERGILVWQDGMFACSLYPDTDPVFLESVKAELTYNIKRLRNFTSLALWSGENECHWGYEEWWDKKKYPRFFGTEIYDKLYPELVKANDPQRFYWNGSPYSGEPAIRANNPNFGDTHFWDLHSNVWDFREYTSHRGSFISETGIQTLPDLRTALTIGNPEDRDIQSYVFDTRNHFESSQKNDRLLKFTAAIFRISDKFEDAVILSNLAQAMYLKYGVEHWRSLAYDTAGVLVWQINDCWPSISWSAVDFNLIPKACFYLLKKAYEPDIVGFIQEYSNNYAPEINSKGELFVASERDGLKAGSITLNIYRVDGTLLETKSFPIKLEGRGAASLGEIELPEYEARRFDCVAEFILKWNDGKTARNLYTFSRPKHMRLPKPEIKLEQRSADSFTVKTDKFAKGIYLFHADRQVIFDDNYFDLLPGEEKIVKSSKPVRTDEIKAWTYYHNKS